MMVSSLTAGHENDGGYHIKLLRSVDCTVGPGFTGEVIKQDLNSIYR